MDENALDVEARLEAVEAASQDPAALIEIASDPDEPYAARVSATSWLTYSDSPPDAQLFRELLEHPDAGEASRELFWHIDLTSPDIAALVEETALDGSPQDLRGFAIRALAEKPGDKERLSELLLSLVRKRSEPRAIREAALEAIGSLGPAAPLPELEALAISPDGLDSTAVVRAIAATGQPAARKFSIRQILDRSLDKYQTEAVRDALHRGTENWRVVAQDVVSELRNGRWRSTDIDPRELVRVMKPPAEDGTLDSRGLSRLLLDAALESEDDDVTSEILASLLVAASNGDKLQAGRRINEFVRARDLPAEALRGLRIHVGGTSALNSVIRKLHANLERNFEGPIRDLNDDTRKMWQRTIKQAQYGFVARFAMSVTVFVVGIAFMVLAVVLFVQGDEENQKMFFGSGVSLVSGLGMMLSMVYRGPLREIRQSVSDLGIASAAFIAYVHRVLEVSHTFSYYYLKEEITFNEMEKSSGLIKAAMQDTIVLLSDAGASPTTPPEDQ